MGRCACAQDRARYIKDGERGLSQAVLVRAERVQDDQASLSHRRVTHVLTHRARTFVQIPPGRVASFAAALPILRLRLNINGELLRRPASPKST